MFSDVIRQKKVVVGEHSGTCVHVRAPNVWFCHAGWHLTDVYPETPNAGTALSGTLVAGGLVDFDEPKLVVAIFGGTGQFKGVVGELHGKFATNEYTFEFSIVP